MATGKKALVFFSTCKLISQRIINMKLLIDSREFLNYVKYALLNIFYFLISIYTICKLHGDSCSYTSLIKAMYCDHISLNSSDAVSMPIVRLMVIFK